MSTMMAMRSLLDQVLLDETSGHVVISPLVWQTDPRSSGASPGYGDRGKSAPVSPAEREQWALAGDGL